MPTGTRAVCVAQRGCGTTAAPNAVTAAFTARLLEQLSGNDAGVPVVGPIGRSPVDHHDEAVAEVDQEVDVRDEPDDPGDETGDLEAADFHHRCFAPDGSQLS